MNRGGFGYCSHTWNPIVGCGSARMSRGCANCWAEKMAMRQKYRELVIMNQRWNNMSVVFPDRLGDPKKRKKHAVIAVAFMGDIFHYSEGTRQIHYDFIRAIWDAMFVAKQHTYLLLTKRPEEMLLFCKWMISRNRNPFYPWVWFGASASDQHDIERIEPAMIALKELGRRQRDSANVWLSIEPLLGRIDTGSQLFKTRYPDSIIKHCRYSEYIDQIIVGGESGHHARPMDAEWCKDILGYCQDRRVPFYMKQMSGREPIPEDIDVKQLAWRMP